MPGENLSVEDRLAALERALAGQLQPAFSPTSGMQVDAAGKVTFDFQGHVHGTGVDLDVGNGANPPQDRRVRWINANGSAIADVYGYQSAPGQAATAVIEASPPEAAGAHLHLTADAINSNASADVTVEAGLNSQSALIIDALGESSFALAFGPIGNLGRLVIQWSGTQLLFFWNGVLVKTL